MTTLIFFFVVISVCVSWRLQVKGQNRAVWRKASDRKCHFNLSTAAVKPGLAHCPARHVTFSSSATGMDVKTINFRQSFGRTISDLFPFIYYLSSTCFVKNAHWQRPPQPPFTFCLFKWNRFFEGLGFNVNFKIDWNIPLQKNVYIFIMLCTIK